MEQKVHASVQFKQSFAVTTIIAAICGLVFFVSACGDNNSLVNTTQDKSDQQNIYNQNQPNKIYQFSFERSVLQQIEDFRVTQLADTWSVWYEYNEPVDGCPSKGFPIANSTELTNPLQTATHGAEGITSIGLADPTGLYESGASDATWVLCVVNGGTYPQRVESHVNTYTYPTFVVPNPQNPGHNMLSHSGSPNPAAKINLNGPTPTPTH